MPIPGYFLGTPADKKKKSKKQEDRIAKKLGGRRQKASGARSFSKGDVRCPDLLVEAKRTDGETIRVDKKWLIKITQEAMGYKLTPALSLEFENMPRLVEQDWIAVPSSFLQQLLEFYKENQEKDG